MINSRLTTIKVVLTVALTALMGCNSGGGTPVRYYLIDPVDQVALPGTSGLRVQILGLHIPQYLERFQIAMRTGRNQLSFSDNHQWGENLRKNLLRTLSRNISKLLDTADVGTPINRSASIPEFRVQVFIEQFDQNNENRVILRGRYQISEGSGGAVLETRSFDYIGQSVDGGFSDMVSSMQALFNDLCVDLAESLRKLDGR